MLLSLSPSALTYPDRTCPLNFTAVIGMEVSRRAFMISLHSLFLTIDGLHDRRSSCIEWVGTDPANIQVARPIRVDRKRAGLP